MIASCSHPPLYFHSPLNRRGKKENPPLRGKHGGDKHGVSRWKKKKKKNQERLRGNDDCFPPRHQSGKNRKNRTLSPSLTARTRMLRVFLNAYSPFFPLFFPFFPIFTFGTSQPVIVMRISRISSRDFLRFFNHLLFLILRCVWLKINELIEKW